MGLRLGDINFVLIKIVRVRSFSKFELVCKLLSNGWPIRDDNNSCMDLVDVINI